MSCLLPPKRFQSEQDPKYDSIRHKPWFWRLSKRRAKLPILTQAHNALTCCHPDTPQYEIATAWGVDARELRDYVDFAQGVSRFKAMPYGLQRTLQAILDRSYIAYDKDSASQTFRSYVDAEAAFWGVDGRQVFELWEVDPIFYPTGYKK